MGRKMLLGPFLKKFLRSGTLTVIHPDGKRETFGSGEPHVKARLHDRRAALELMLNPDLKLGELYMDGRLTVEDGHIRDLLELAQMNVGLRPPTGLRRLVHTLQMLFRPLTQFNPAGRAKAHVAHHYDLDGRLYDLFLGRDKQY